MKFAIYTVYKEGKNNTCKQCSYYKYESMPGKIKHFEDGARW